MEHYEMQVTLQLPITSDMVAVLPDVYYNLDTAIKAARKAAEGIADAAEAAIVRVNVLHYPSGSGEPVITTA